MKPNNMDLMIGKYCCLEFGHLCLGTQKFYGILESINEGAIVLSKIRQICDVSYISLIDLVNGDFDVNQIRKISNETPIFAFKHFYMIALCSDRSLEILKSYIDKPKEINN